MRRITSLVLAWITVVGLAVMNIVLLYTCSSIVKSTFKIREDTVSSTQEQAIKDVTKALARNVNISGYVLKKAKTKVFLVIGIPTVYRAGGSYIFTTLSSLVSCTSSEDKSRVKLVVQLSDFNISYHGKVKAKIQEMFPKELSNEFILIRNVSAEKYPPLEHLKQNFGDSTVRVKWRAKQTLDTAFLMKYCQDMAEYYVHIEDDVITRPGYVREISEFINESGSSWSVLELSFVGAIGKVFRNSDLPKLVNLLTSFYEEQPVDFLFMHFKSITVQTKQYVRIPTVFKHIGAKSTLVNQTRSDGMDSLFFYMQQKRLKGDNPNATIETNLGVYQEYYIDKAYNKLNSDFFWGYSKSSNNFVLIIFTVPQNVTKVVIDSGFIADENNLFNPLNVSSNLNRRDYIMKWSLDYSNELVRKGTSSTCEVFRSLQEYVEGPVQVEDVLRKTNGHVNCLRLSIVSQVNWIFIREIGVYVTS